jgi:hypothetical protein
MGSRSTGAAKKAAKAAAVATQNGGANGASARDQAAVRELLDALKAAKAGDFSVRLPARRSGLMGQVATAFNDLVAGNARMAKELQRVGRVVGREGR